MKEALNSLAAGRLQEPHYTSENPQRFCCSWNLFLGQLVGKKKESIHQVIICYSRHESHLILLFSIGIENIFSPYPTHSFTISSNHKQNYLFDNCAVT